MGIPYRSNRTGHRAKDYEFKTLFSNDMSKKQFERKAKEEEFRQWQAARDKGDESTIVHVAIDAVDEAEAELLSAELQRMNLHEALKRCFDPRNSIALEYYLFKYSEARAFLKPLGL